MAFNLNPAFNSSVDTYVPDNLIIENASSGEYATVVVISGENRTRGAVLGRTATAGTAVGAAVAGNAGDGTIGSVSAVGGAREGVYRAVIIEPATNAGKFLVYRPDGSLVGGGTVAVAFSNEVAFTIADGSADFASGDSFTITVSAVTYKWKLSATAATDGSADLRAGCAVLLQDTDASAGDVSAPALIGGAVGINQRALTFGTGHSATSNATRDALASHGIYLLNSIKA